MYGVVKFQFEVSSKKAPIQTRQYVGTIIQIYANRIQVKFARPYQNCLTTFHFLDEERREADDVEIVQFGTVKKNSTIPQN